MTVAGTAKPCQLVIGIDGMTCSSCVGTVESVLRNLPSVSKVDVSLTNNCATIECDRNQLTNNTIIDEVESNGFGAVVLSETPLQTSRASSFASNTPKNTRRRLVLEIDGMTCSSCTSTVESALSNHPGVEQVQVSLSTNSATVIYDTTQTKAKELMTTVEDVGFDVHLLEEQDALTLPSYPSTVLTEPMTSRNTPSSPFPPPPKSLLLTVDSPEVSLRQIDAYLAELEMTAGVISATLSDEKERQIMISFNDEFVGPRKFYLLAKARGFSITISSFGSFLMASRLQKMQQQEKQELQTALIISLLLSIPVFIIGMIVPMLPEPLPKLTEWRVISGLTFSSLIQLIFSTPIQWIIGYRFHKKALLTMKTKTLGMDFMISTGTTAAYVYSILAVLQAVFHPQSMRNDKMENTYFDTTAMLITVVIFGKYLEAYAKARTAEAIHRLNRLKVNTARLVGIIDSNHYETENETATFPTAYLPIPIEEVQGLAPTGASSSAGSDLIIDSILLQKHDVIRIVAGEGIPADGVLLPGSQISVDESLLTGESQTILKTGKETIYGGAMVIEGSALMRVTHVGDESTLGKILQTMQEAQISKPKIQEFADQVAAYFVPTVMIISILTFITWMTAASLEVVPVHWIEMIGGGNPFLFAFNFALAVWVSACPCAFGLATPTAIFVATGLAAKYGILIRKGAALQTASEIDTICFDKTGTLTRGLMEVTDFIFQASTPGTTTEAEEVFIPLPSTEEITTTNDEDFQATQQVRKQTVESERLTFFLEMLKHIERRMYLQPLYEVFQALVLTEQRSNHPVAKSITEYCQQMLQILEHPYFSSVISKRKSPFSQYGEESLGIEQYPGQGVRLFILPTSSPERSEPSSSELDVLVGNYQLLTSQGVNISSNLEALAHGYSATGKVLIYVAINHQVQGIIALSDRIRPEVPSVLEQLQYGKGIKCYVVTGDQLPTALAVGSAIGLPPSQILAEVKPEEKSLFIAALQAQGRKVAFVGDGMNDGPALAQANTGIALATGAELAMAAGDVLLCQPNLQMLVTLLDLSSKTLWRIRWNYLWAFGYNSCLIPIAAGVFYPAFHFALQPMYAGAAMALSSVSIVLSSLLLSFFRPSLSEEPLMAKLKRTLLQRRYQELTSNSSTSVLSSSDSSSHRLIREKDLQELDDEQGMELLPRNHTAASSCHCPSSSHAKPKAKKQSCKSQKRQLSPPTHTGRKYETFSQLRFQPLTQEDHEDDSWEDIEAARKPHYDEVEDEEVEEPTAQEILEAYLKQIGDDRISHAKTRPALRTIRPEKEDKEKEQKKSGCGCGANNCQCPEECSCGATNPLVAANKKSEKNNESVKSVIMDEKQ